MGLSPRTLSSAFKNFQFGFPSPVFLCLSLIFRYSYQLVSFVAVLLYWFHVPCCVHFFENFFETFLGTSAAFQHCLDSVFSPHWNQFKGYFVTPTTAGTSVKRGHVVGVIALARTVPGTKLFTLPLGTFWNGCANGSRTKQYWTEHLCSHYILEVCRNVLNCSGLPVWT